VNNQEVCKIAISTVKEYLNIDDCFEKVIFKNSSEEIIEIYRGILVNY
jgi:metal-responsive CopG/Arc/MetJ family transcriptional regulator